MATPRKATATKPAPANLPPTIVVPMAFGKETKGTWVFYATSEDAPVTTLYVRKDAMPNDIPVAIHLTIEGV
jgi:hypothetical protein